MLQKLGLAAAAAAFSGVTSARPSHLTQPSAAQPAATVPAALSTAQVEVLCNLFFMWSSVVLYEINHLAT
jgi:hypothetical protein